jgi:hypothetical protein
MEQGFRPRNRDRGRIANLAELHSSSSTSGSRRKPFERDSMSRFARVEPMIGLH